MPTKEELIFAPRRKRLLNRFPKVSAGFCFGAAAAVACAIVFAVSGSFLATAHGLAPFCVGSAIVFGALLGQYIGARRSFLHVLQAAFLGALVVLLSYGCGVFMYVLQASIAGVTKNYWWDIPSVIESTIWIACNGIQFSGAITFPLGIAAAVALYALRGGRAGPRLLGCGQTSHANSVHTVGQIRENSL